MSLRPLCLTALLGLALATPLAAQQFDPSLGVEPVAVLEDGRLMVKNGGSSFDCALVVKTDSVMLSECAPRASEGDAAAKLAEMTEADWQALVRKTMVEAECKISALGGVADLVAAAAVENGAAPEEVEKMRAHLAEKAEAAVDRMMKEGKLSVMDGELVLYDCP